MEMKNSNPGNTLLYLSGNNDIDNLIEEQFPGEDVFVSFYHVNTNLILSIEDYEIHLELRNISQIKMEYDDGTYILNYKNEACVFSFEGKISYELIALFTDLKLKLEIPEFINSRYQQMQDKALLKLIDNARDFIALNDYIHYYDEIDEYGYSGIVESFAEKALNELPLIYIKYMDAGEKENGFLVTYNGIYSPEKSISISEIKSVSIEKVIYPLFSIQCSINNNPFATFPMVIEPAFPGSYEGFNLSLLIDGIEKLIKKICGYRNAGRVV